MVSKQLVELLSSASVNQALQDNSRRFTTPQDFGLGEFLYLKQLFYSAVCDKKMLLTAE